MNQLGLFGGRDKVIWQQEAMPWMAPAHECLHAVGLAAAKVDDWLIVQQQLELIDGGTQGGDQRCSDRLKDFSGDENRAWRICGPSRQDDKLVSTEATHRVRFAEDSSQASSNFLEYAIAMLVTERVVDLLEAIQVEDEECLRLPLALCA